MIVPAIIAETQNELDQMLSKVQGKAERVMLDFMDGIFVPSKSLDFDIELPEGIDYEAHLMVHNPLNLIEKLKDKVRIIQLQVESLKNIKNAVNRVKNLGFNVYLALNPDTPITTVEPHLKSIDGVLIMTVQPGQYGSKFLPSTLDKVKKLRELYADLSIEVDGGMNPDTAQQAKKAGANIFASGSYIMKSGDIGAAIRRLQEAVA